MEFASRMEAGHRLGRLLRDLGVEVDLVLGLPRGGVVVAAEVARVLQRPLDVLVVRKIGHSWHREFAVGALAEPDVVILDEASLGRNPIGRSQLDEVIAEETERLGQYRKQFHRGGTPDLAGKSLLLVDDGLATGATTVPAVVCILYGPEVDVRMRHRRLLVGNISLRGERAPGAKGVELTSQAELKRVLLDAKFTGLSRRGKDLLSDWRPRGRRAVVRLA